MIKRGLRFSNNTQMKEKKVRRVGNGEWTAGEWNCAIFHWFSSHSLCLPHEMNVLWIWIIFWRRGWLAKPWWHCPCIRRTASAHPMTRPGKCTEEARPCWTKTSPPVSIRPRSPCPPNPKSSPMGLWSRNGRDIMENVNVKMYLCSHVRARVRVWMT